jgi:murein DD-endopeptidase MepM/ murein hydrolase activator NlpD
MRWAALLLALCLSAPSGAQDVARPIYAERTRFSDTAGIVDFVNRKPRAVIRAVEPSTAAPASPQPPRAALSSQALREVMIHGVPAGSGVRLSSRFGSRADPWNGTARLHAGLDLAVPYGSAVVARSPGVVVFAGWLGGYGNCVEVDHGGGVRTRYGHLARTLVVPGTQVSAGMTLGVVGSTGRSTGPHLHYEVRVNGAPINPFMR